MSPSEIAVIVMLGGWFVAVLVSPKGALKWGRRPWFIHSPPRRGYVAAFIGFILLGAIINAFNK